MKRNYQCYPFIFICLRVTPFSIECRNQTRIRENSIEYQNNVVVPDLFTWTSLCCVGVIFQGRGRGNRPGLKVLLPPSWHLLPKAAFFQQFPADEEKKNDDSNKYSKYPQQPLIDLLPKKLQ